MLGYPYEPATQCDSCRSFGYPAAGLNNRIRQPAPIRRPNATEPIEPCDSASGDGRLPIVFYAGAARAVFAGTTGRRPTKQFCAGIYAVARSPIVAAGSTRRLFISDGRKGVRIGRWRVYGVREYRRHRRAIERPRGFANGTRPRGAPRGRPPHACSGLTRAGA
jgi:hypothetical protein